MTMGKTALLVCVLLIFLAGIDRAASQSRFAEPENSMSSVFRTLVRRYCDMEIPPDIEFDALFDSLRLLGDRMRTEAVGAARGSARQVDRLEIHQEILQIQQEARAAQRVSNEALEPYRQLCRVLKNPALLR